jgi:hypothetical protein
MAVDAPNIAAQDAAPPASPAGPETPRRRGRLLARQGHGGEVRIYQHSNLLYWWAVWAYGLFCAGLTYLQGVGVPQLAATADKQILFHPSPWLGISFIALMLFVVVFTNVRARGSTRSF